MTLPVCDSLLLDHSFLGPAPRFVPRHPCLLCLGVCSLLSSLDLVPVCSLRGTWRGWGSSGIRLCRPWLDRKGEHLCILLRAYFGVSSGGFEGECWFLGSHPWKSTPPLIPHDSCTRFYMDIFSSKEGRCLGRMLSSHTSNDVWLKAQRAVPPC